MTYPPATMTTEAHPKIHGAWDILPSRRATSWRCPDPIRRHLFDDSGRLQVVNDQIRVDLVLRTYTPVLIDAGPPESDVSIPLRGGRTLRFGFLPRSPETARGFTHRR